MPATSPLAPARKRHTILATMLALALASAIGAAPAFADDFDAISGTPSDGSVKDARTTFSYQLDAGQQITDYYLARNTGTTALTATVFATDAFNAPDGGYALLDTSAAPKEAGAWITFDGGAKKVEVPLQPGESKVIPFALDVPADAGPGDHAGGILMSVQKGDGQVLVDRRVATRLYVRVPGDLQPILSFTKFTANYDAQWNPFDGTTNITATVKNKGNVALASDALIGVKGPFGIPLGKTSSDDVPELLPGGETTISYQIKGIGQLAILTPYISLTPKVAGDALKPGPLPVVTRDSTVVAVPWWLVIVVVIVALVLVFLRIRSKRDEKAALAWIAHTEAEAQRKAIEHGEAASESSLGVETR